LNVAELVEAEQIEASVAGDDPRQSPFVGGLDEFVDELRGRRVADSAALFAGEVCPTLPRRSCRK